ncbi:MAG TPA: CbbQ/NirQ/NorQ C-terminal domain-containing protein, partial [Amaricoccus sp.]|nr:CbbQ/NirQ/NorQ C-terminal domain-containing protein [Amaricoccus sp.]
HYIVNISTAALPLTEEVVLGKQVWERESCINCHTLHGEGACLAREVGNVTTRWDLEEGVSTRLLVYAATLIRGGMPVDRALQAAVVEPLSDEAEVQQALRDLAAAVYGVAS